ncbi:matrix metalloproteinase-2-like [Temnothorax curvispinosus]|uniref:Matrix metalloproteinase-2-like n=1 Tax=Temnothorax curvispinosus TaxID=300111 RepID=A0A6J1PCV8_9HYME|nr:matrix metalloproteinase-2-like [Temnothorax curvispinosus]
MRLAYIIALTACFNAATCINSTITDDNYAFTFDYLLKYGYLSNDVDAIPAQRRNDVFRKAFKEFQNYYNLPGDGTLNNETLKFMSKSRCGFRDILKHETKASLSKWPKTHLTWHFHLADENELNTAQAAFDLWSQHSALTFERSEMPNADIIISWRRLLHYNTNIEVNGELCSDKFDGPGNVLAHAFFPTEQAGFVSEVHVDGDEPWHIYVNKHPADKFSLHYTLTHEIGHSLGLPHNRRTTSVMFAIQPDQQYPVKLDQYDIVDIQRLYGEKIQNDKPRRTPAPAPPPPPSPDLCSLDRVNGILILENRMYISYKRYVWSVDLDGRTYNGPLALSKHMSFLHDNYTRVTAAYQSPSGDLMVFVDNLVYLVQYPEFSLRPGWPKTLQELGFPENALINGAVNTHRGRSYVVFNGNAVGEINECDQDKRVAKFTPLEATFPGIPKGVTSIFRYIDGNLYFTTRSQFYKFNEFTRTVSSAGKFDLRILNIVCPKAELLQQLRDLLDRIVRFNDNSLTSASDYWNDDDTGVRLSDFRIRRRK